jgi:hypothetical protein
MRCKGNVSLAVPCGQSASAGLRQPKSSKSSQGISQGDQALPMDLRNIALVVTLANFKQRIELLGAQRVRRIMNHLCTISKIGRA